MARIFFAYITYLRLAVESLRNLEGILSSGNERGRMEEGALSYK